LKHLLAVNKYLFRYKRHFVLGIVFVSLANYFGILIPQKIREALDLVQLKISAFKDTVGNIDSPEYNQLSDALLAFGLTITLFVVLKGIFMYLMRQTIIVMSRLIEYDMRKDIFDHLTNLDQGFYRKYMTGDIMSRISEDVSKVRNYIGPGILYAINLITTFIFTIYAMLKVDLTLTLCTLLPLPILSISIYYVSNLINKKSAAIQAQLSTLTSEAQETYSGIKVIKSYVKEDAFAKFFDIEGEKFKTLSLGLARVESYFQPLMLLLIAMSTIIVVVVGGYQVEAGRLTAGNIAEFILYVNMLTWPVTAIGWIASTVQEAAASQARINDLMNEIPTIINSNNDEYGLKGEIKFENVTFTYKDTGTVALKDLNLSIKPGQRVAIMGRTAAGKSSIAELLTRTYDVDEGSIKLDGVDIKSHNLKVVRRDIGYVPQDVFLFSDTIKANIAFGKPEAKIDEIQAYAQYAKVHSEIELFKNGYDTLLGERGVTLSGGQKQRISIARAFIKESQIIVLDDALSAVDANSEQEIINYFDEALIGKTTIVITHRTNNLLNYDNIIIIENGKIADQGTHQELILREGFYQNLYLQQTSIHI
jgi:ATP-binding cassette subfamily B multidrug efflux pump